MRDFEVILISLLIIYFAYIRFISWVGGIGRPLSSDDITQEILCGFCNATAQGLQRYSSNLVENSHPCLASNMIDDDSDIKELLVNQRVCAYFLEHYHEQIWNSLNGNVKVLYQYWLCHQLTFSCVKFPVRGLKNKDEERIKAEIEKNLRQLRTFYF